MQGINEHLEYDFHASGFNTWMLMTSLSETEKGGTGEWGEGRVSLFGCGAREASIRYPRCPTVISICRSELRGEVIRGGTFYYLGNHIIWAEVQMKEKDGPRFSLEEF